MLPSARHPRRGTFRSCRGHVVSTSGHRIDGVSGLFLDRSPGCLLDRLSKGHLVLWGGSVLSAETVLWTGVLWTPPQQLSSISEGTRLERRPRCVCGSHDLLHDGTVGRGRVRLPVVMTAAFDSDASRRKSAASLSQAAVSCSVAPPR